MPRRREELEKNQADLVRATAQVEQLRKAKEQFDHQAQVDRDRLALVVAHSQADVNDLQAKIDSARVLAPVKGTLYSLPVHVRDFVHTGDLLAEVADLSQVRVRAFIDEPELGRLQPQQVVEVTWDAMPERTWMGRTEALPQQVVARGARNVGEVLCAISNEKMSLIPNTTVDVRIQLAERSNVLLVPRGAVQTDGSRRYVFSWTEDVCTARRSRWAPRTIRNLRLSRACRKAMPWRCPAMRRSRTMPWSAWPLRNDADHGQRQPLSICGELCSSSGLVPGRAARRAGPRRASPRRTSSVSITPASINRP